jgi:hypothetical protein
MQRKRRDIIHASGQADRWNDKICHIVPPATHSRYSCSGIATKYNHSHVGGYWHSREKKKQLA